MKNDGLLPKCKEILLFTSAVTAKEMDDLAQKSYLRMSDRKILQHISWTVLLSGYQLQSAQKIWPDIKSAMLWFHPRLINLFPKWCSTRLSKAFDNQKKVRALTDNAVMAFELIKKHGSLREWLNTSDNILEELVNKYSYIGNTNVKSLLHNLGFHNMHKHEPELVRTLDAWNIPGVGPGSRAAFGALTGLCRESGLHIVEGYAIVYLFSRAFCGSTRRCGNCLLEQCPGREK